MGLLAFNSGSEESWRSDDDVADDPAVLRRSGAGAKANVDRGTVASARAATNVFMVDKFTHTPRLQRKSECLERSCDKRRTERERCKKRSAWRWADSCVVKYSTP